MFVLKVIVSFSFLMKGLSSEINDDIMREPSVGGQLDNNCLIGAGYTWCESSQSCIRQWITPCYDCIDCLTRQRNGENIACPQECDLVNLDCNIDKDCPNTHFCRVSMNNGPKACVPYSNEGESCGGYRLPANQMRCSPELECANTMGPMIADAPGNCMRPCKPGHTRDSYGNCNQVRSGILGGPERPMPTDLMPTDPMPADPMPTDPMPPEPMPPVIRPFGPRPTDPLDPTSICPEVMCEMYCENDFHKDANGCDMCLCNEIHNPECPIPYEDCNGKVCPKVTEITHCSEGGIPGYTTYQLSLIIKDKNIKNIYALFGPTGDQHVMIIPRAYQITNTFGSNIGGISESLISINPDSEYDSWLTIGITDGDQSNKLGTIGIDYEFWSVDSPLSIRDGAIFLLDPTEEHTGEIIIGQLTIPVSRHEEAIINVQGKLNDGSSWIQYDIQFPLNPPIIIGSDTVPNDCEVWFDGCNTCQSNNGILGACTRIMCFREETPYCLRQISGH